MAEGTIVRAVARNQRISPRKARLVADMIRGLPVDRALAILRLTPKKGARMFEKVVRSAFAIAEENHGLDIDGLVIAECRVDEGTTLKRWRPKGMGRIRRRYHKHSHLVVGVRERG